MIIKFRMNFWIACLFCIFLLQDAIALKISWVSYLDEIETGIVLLIILFGWLKGKRILLERDVTRLLGIWILFIICGLIGNIISQYQSGLFVLIDLLTYSKLVINFVAVQMFFKPSGCNIYEDSVRISSYVITLILLSLVIHDTYFEPIFPYLNDRYGTRSLQLFFSNQTYLAVTGVLLMIIHYCFGENRKGTWIWIIMDSIIVISTFRTKALGFVVVALVTIFLFSRMKYINRKNIMVVGLCLIIVAVYVGWDYLDYYFLSGNKYSIRLLLLNGGIELANIAPPFGMGFGTYCSLASKMNVSPVYSLLGMSNIYLARSMYDVFWGAVIGQFGYLGLSVYLYYIFGWIRHIIKWKSCNNRLFWSGLLLLIYLVIASLGEASFNTYYTCIIGVFLGYMNRRKECNRENEKNIVSY